MLPTTASILTLRSGSTLLLDGPVSVRVKTGEAACLGAPLIKGAWFTVRAGRRAPIESLSDSRLEIRSETDASYKVLAQSTIPGSWREASQIVQQVQGRIVILGNVDSGKSTLCNFLVNEAQSSNLTTTIIDADIGQADIGPPTTISGAVIQNPILDLQTLTPRVSCFVGDTSPGNVTGKIWNGLAIVHQTLPESEVLVVNTDGWLEGPDAYAYKQGLLERIEPSLILAISDEETRDPLDLLLDSQKCTVLKLERSEHARKRTREERKRAREAGYRRFLEGARRIDLDQDQIAVRRFDSPQTLLELPDDNGPGGVLSGLLDRNALLIGICRVLHAGSNRISVETAVREVVHVQTLELGAVVLSSEYEEVGFSSHM